MGGGGTQYGGGGSYGANTGFLGPPAQMGGGGNFWGGGAPLQQGFAGTQNTNAQGAAYGWNPGGVGSNQWLQTHPNYNAGPQGTTNTNAQGTAYGWNPAGQQQQGGYDISQAYNHLFGGGFGGGYGYY